jgi:hypothetical protein
MIEDVNIFQKGCRDANIRYVTDACGKAPCHVSVRHGQQGTEPFM